MSPESPHQVNPLESGEGKANPEEVGTVEKEEKSQESPGVADPHAAFERIALQVGEIKRVQKNFLDTSNRFVATVRTRAPYGGFKVGAKIEDSSQYKDILALREVSTHDVRALVVSLEKMKGEVSPEAAEESEKAVATTLDELERIFSKVQASNQDLFKFTIHLGRKISEFHNGRGSEDEDFLKGMGSLFKDLHSSMDAMVKLSRMKRNT